MSNENSYTNRPLRKSGRTRDFSISTYLNEGQISLVLAFHENQIRAYAYAYHDKDTFSDDVIDKEGNIIHKKGELKAPHTHIVIKTHNACTISAVERWFYGFLDSEGVEINTFVQKASNIYSAYDYLTHDSKRWIDEGKYPYDKSIIRGRNVSYFMADERSEYDNLTLALFDYINGVTHEVLVKRYGRDYIIHQHQISSLGYKIMYDRDSNIINDIKEKILNESEIKL